MPYKSRKQEEYFNANRAELEAKGVNVEEWNKASKGLNLPNKVMKKDNEATETKPDKETGKGEDHIDIQKSHKGLFTAKAVKAGMSVPEYAKHVLSHRSQFDAATRAQAIFAHNEEGWNKK